jgi:hypothetical protein
MTGSPVSDFNHAHKQERSGPVNLRFSGQTFFCAVRFSLVGL